MTSLQVNKKAIIIICYGHLTARSIAKLCNTNLHYVYRVWQTCDLRNIRESNVQIARRRLRELNAKHF